MTSGVLDRAIGRISARTARGLNGVPAGLVKCLGIDARGQLVGIYSDILAGQPIRTEWLWSRITLTPKKGRDSGLPWDYHPLTVTV